MPETNRRPKLQRKLDPQHYACHILFMKTSIVVIDTTRLVDVRFNVMQMLDIISDVV